ncbi:hypothetical protein PIB30_039015 [Stylosanthes scabra]|uniref:Uncharacterized protein n=1 Tax=Stylosanthes scabra TaxID=79078 RepID=A0ABU6QDL9_9FABA|nr:hypothetical protein [Stylosanthes scabra]
MAHSNNINNLGCMKRVGLSRMNWSTWMQKPSTIHHWNWGNAHFPTLDPHACLSWILIPTGKTYYSRKMSSISKVNVAPSCNMLENHDRDDGSYAPATTNGYDHSSFMEGDDDDDGYDYAPAA